MLHSPVVSGHTHTVIMRPTSNSTTQLGEGVADGGGAAGRLVSGGGGVVAALGVGTAPPRRRPGRTTGVGSGTRRGRTRSSVGLAVGISVAVGTGSGVGSVGAGPEWGGVEG